MQHQRLKDTAEILLATALTSQLEELQGVCGELAGIRYLSRLPESCYEG